MMKNLRIKALHGAKWATIQNGLGQVIDFIIFITLARLLGPEEFGLVAIAIVVISLMSPFVTQGLGAAIVQKEKLESEHKDSVFWVNLAVGLLLTVFLVSTSDILASVFSVSQLAPVLSCVAFSFLFISLTTVQEALVRRELRIKELAVRSLIAKLIGGVLGVLLALNDFGVWSLVVKQLATALINMALLWKISTWRPRFRFSKVHFQELYPFGLKVLGNEVLVFVNRRSAHLIIAYFLGAVALSFYNIANRFMMLFLRLITQSVRQVGMPLFSRIQNSPEKVQKGFLEISQIIALISIPLFCGGSVLAPEIVSLLLGEKWLPAVPVFQILMLVGIVQSLLSPMVSVLVGLGYPGLRLKLQCIDAVVNIIGFFVAVHWGIVTVAYTYTVIGFLLWPLWYITVKKVVFIDTVEYFKIIIGPIVGTTVMAIWIIETQQSQLSFVGLTSTIFSVVTGAIVYVLIMHFFFQSTSKKMMHIILDIFVKTGK